ncbi:hypothetical protein L5515_006134 [Caenorhabditis briggsae]|uniref:Glycosyltransferase family 92 protein n=1 Tax=Caenorhabditis briggsae TaxID=6238 RepID=A0AAE9JKI4_CAEBR|nr:hypothetical protein L5515_006134 [Caenorhabditis briggsae]
MSATMQKLWKTLLILALTSLVVFIFYFDEKKNEKLRDDNIPIVFYKEAYLDYRQLLKEAKVGALEFKHTRLQLDLNSEKTGFERKSLENPILLEKSGPVKLVFNTSSVGITLTHSIKKFINSSLKTIEVPIGLLLHYRYNGGQEAMRNKNTNFKIFEKNFEAHIRNMDTVTKSIFQEKRNLYEPRIILELNECIEEMRQSLVCRSTVVNCKSRMEKLVSNWKYETTSGIFVF